MPRPRMHADEVDVDESLVRRLLAAQLPLWADLPVDRVPSAGTDNAMFRLGTDLAVRLPRYPSAALQVAKEHRWVGALAPRLPFPVPVPLAQGEPGEGFPWHWSVVPWLDGENATVDRIPDPDTFAADVASFVTALRAIDATGGPPPGAHNFRRGVPLADREDWMRPAIAACEGLVDVAAVTAAWDAALAAPPWEGAPVWVHGDLQEGNLLVSGGRLAAVLDFGGLGVGDPAYDLMVAWNLLPAGSRPAFRAAVGADDATWTRARGLALSVAVVALPYYLETNAAITAAARRTIREVVDDHGAS